MTFHGCTVRIRRNLASSTKAFFPHDNPHLSTITQHYGGTRHPERAGVVHFPLIANDRQLLATGHADCQYRGPLLRTALRLLARLDLFQRGNSVGKVIDLRQHNAIMITRQRLRTVIGRSHKHRRPRLLRSVNLVGDSTDRPNVTVRVDRARPCDEFPIGKVVGGQLVDDRQSKHQPR